MATVGNLFVNVRGRTGGFVRDMKRAHKSVRKDFYVNEAMAMQNLRKARERVGALNFASPERFAAGMKGLRVSEARLSIAQSRPGRLAERRGLLAAKERGEAARAFLAREAKALIPLVFGVPAAALAFVVSQSVKAFSAASRFAVMGPQGGRVVEANVGKMLDAMEFAQRPDVSGVMSRTAQIERENALLWREVGLQLQIVSNFVFGFLGLSMESPPVAGDPGFVSDRQNAAQIRMRNLAERASRLPFGQFMTGYDS